ncbi:MAG: molybdenum cofactor biosynthesis protein MoaE [Cyanobacteria bacterium NC_groundwater_1444_Ag_S-0.65um_54_12]|nr:molybdenum cofactor biosynthesis protein MoaE [Cyanobacteria bacterium NC_groundwater_1444_Ag_S-0.65um_54_12]
MIQLTTEPIDIVAAERLLHHRSVGAIATFVGTIRNHNQGRSVYQVEYEAYQEMAQRQMEALGREIASRWPVERVVLIHRTGLLEIGDVAVFVGVSSAHRHTAFEACRYGIDMIKAEVPVWKHEILVPSELPAASYATAR